MEADGWHCEGCGARYPRYGSLIDFRMSAPRGDLSFAHRGAVEDEPVRVLRALESFFEKSFADIVDDYLAGYDTTSSLIEAERKFLLAWKRTGEEWRFQLAQVIPLDELGKNQQSVALDLGCGVGGLIVTTMTAFDTILGLDADLYRLVLAQKLCQEHGLDNVMLVCAYAESLPVRSSSVDLLTSIEVLEHASDQASMLSEIKRVLKIGGHLYLTTPNRFSLTPEPHVKLFGVGFLPRRWMDPFTRLFAGVPYDGKRNPSLKELTALMDREFRGRYRIVREKRSSYTPQARIAGPLLRLPLISRSVAWFVSGFHVVASKHQDGP